MATIGDWKEYFKSLDDNELKDIRKALKTLSKFDKICEEFDGTGLFILDALAKLELDSRAVEEVER